jgi:hypothetical protein
MSHTPGPWEVKNQIQVFSLLGADSGDGCKAQESDGWQIADCSEGETFVPGGMMDLGFDVKKANARLIAMSPQLLIALEDAAKIMRGITNQLPLLNARVDAYDRLIAKARGQE